MGDFKPSTELKARLPEAVLLGIENHRLVDRLTDQYQPVKRLRRRFSAKRRRFAGVITDITFDYFLTKHWQTFAVVDYQDFVDASYHGLSQCTNLMPPRMSQVVKRLVAHSWLENYATLVGIGLTIDQVSKRMRFENAMAGAIDEVELLYPEIEEVFLGLFAYLQTEVAAANIEGREG